MKKQSILKIGMLLCAFLFELPLLAQGVIVYKKDGKMVNYPYEFIDSIVTYNYEDTPPVAVAVDLGLSVKWANFNVGATKPEEYGDYYAWGETATKYPFDWSNYKWCEGTDESFTKYCTNSEYGTVDNRTVLTPNDDVATVVWGAPWRMPTHDEMGELINKCTWEWTTYNGIAGQLVTGPNGNSIFLPAAGYDIKTNKYAGKEGYYWSASLSDYHDYAYFIYFLEDGPLLWKYYFRSFGYNVRPVRE